MPTIITHGVASILIGKTMLSQSVSWRLWFWTAFCAILPDFDVIGFSFGIQYGDFWGHRGFTHSLTFAFLLSTLINLFFYKKLQVYRKGRFFWLVFFFVVTMSHGFFDGWTNGGLGIAYFSPFDLTRYFFPWTPVLVSPIGVKALISERGWQLMLSESRYILIPFVLIWSFVSAMRKSKKRV